jgi:glutathione synthase/RimK-type ligase-like ATP-grasp enzyme
MFASDPPTKERMLVRALREAAEEREIAFETFSSQWIVRLTRAAQRRYVFGYNFDINSATAVLLADDKTAVSDLLESDGVPHVEHRLFLHPRMTDFVGIDGNWTAAVNFAGGHDYQVVCKPNVGTGGSGVQRVRSRRELETAFQELHQRGYSLTMAPFYDVAAEYRAVILDGRCLLTYEKRLPTIKGDGFSTVAQLVLMAMARGEIAMDVGRRSLAACQDEQVTVPGGEVVRVGWKHNLGRGAEPARIADPTIRQPVIALAERATEAIGIRCAAVDVIATEGEMLVLEINAGIALEHYAQKAASGFDTTKRVYGEIIDTAFGSP